MLRPGPQRAFPAWRDMRPIDRGRILTDIGRMIRANRDRLAAMEARETGKVAAQAAGEIEMSAQYFEYYGGLANIFYGEVINIGAPYHSYTRREPFGVVATILPGTRRSTRRPARSRLRSPLATPSLRSRPRKRHRR